MSKTVAPDASEHVIMTLIGISVHQAGDSPIWGETATHVMVEDDGAGPYIALRQFHPNLEPGKVILDLDELEPVLRAARRLMGAQPR